jgi:tRNA A37 methylthiotransferase MiaB
MDDQISEEVKHQRVSLLTKIAAEIRSEILVDFLKKGQRQTVLFETYKNGFATGHTEHFLEVRVKSKHPLDGTYRAVHLCGSDTDRLYGELI